MGIFNIKTVKEGKYTYNEVTYTSTTGDGEDFVCQKKFYNKEECHCTWHPDGSVHKHGECDGCYSNCRRKKEEE